MPAVARGDPVYAATHSTATRVRPRAASQGAKKPRKIGDFVAIVEAAARQLEEAQSRF